MRKLFTGVLFLLLVCFSSNSFGYDDHGYPYNVTSGCGSCPSGDAYRLCANNCTSYVAYMLNQYGIPFHNSYRLSNGNTWGDAGLWDDAAGKISGSADIVVDTNPLPGDVAYWNTLGGTGHVAWVEKVYFDSNGNATSIDITEYNVTPCAFSSRNISVNNPNGFIHVLAYEEGVNSLHYLNCYEMWNLCDSQTQQEWEWIVNRVYSYRCQNCDGQYQAYADAFYDGTGFGGAGASPPPIPGPRADLVPDFDIYDASGNEISANCNNCPGKPVSPGQTIRAKLWTEVSNADAADFKRDSGSNTIEGPVWWKIEGKTSWNLLASGEYTISNLYEDNKTVETHTWTVPNYPGDILAMQACVDGDDEIWEESESSTQHEITSPNSSGTTNNCSRIERFYIQHPNYTPTGDIEGGDCVRVQGWAKDGNTTGSLQVNVSVSDPGGGNLQNINPLVANGYRTDLGGNYGIEWIFPDFLRDGNPHVIKFSAVNIPAGTNPEIGNISLTCEPATVQIQGVDSAIQLLLQQ